MRLNTFDNSKSALAGLIRAYKKDQLSDVKFRNLVHAMSVYLAYWNAEKRDDLEREVDDLRDMVERIRREHAKSIT